MTTQQPADTPPAPQCAVCTQPSTQRHDRLYKSRSNKPTADEYVHLCDQHHQQAHTPMGEQLGWTVRAGNDPRLVPMFDIGREQWVRDGEIVPAADAVEYMVLVAQIGSGMER